LAVFAAHAPLVRAGAERGLERLGERLGEEVRVEHIEVQGLAGVRLHRLRIGPLAAPKLTVRHATARLDVEALKARRVQPTLIELVGPTLHIRGDGTLEGAARAAMTMVPEALRDMLRGEGGEVAEDGDARPRHLPDVLVRRGHLLDHGGAIEVVEGELTFSDGRLTAKGRVVTPDLGWCTLEGGFVALQIECERPFRQRLPGGLRVEAARVELERRPLKRVRVPELRLTAGDAARHDVAAMVGGLAADVRLGLEANRLGERVLEVALLLPGGGRIDGQGTVGRAGLKLAAEVADLKIDGAHEAVGGTISGHYRLEVDRKKGEGFLEGEGRLRQVVLMHGALAEGPIGPLDLSVEGRLDVRLLDRATHAIEARVDGARVTLGEIGADITAFVDTTPGTMKLRLTVDAGRFDAPALIKALPKGLLPHLEPIIARGPMGFRALVDIDQTDLKATKLDVDLDVRKVDVKGINPNIDFETLRDVFTTRFEMPGEKEDELIILEREQGPNSPRWVPLEEIPALLPLAVTAQEDGGFYRHKGVSLLHLRGSLIRNLERGRFARGGSTLTMQLARNLFLNRRKTLSRKLEELVLTWLLEQAFDKDELMALYLNVVEFGPDIFGIGEAAEHYFGRKPIELAPEQIAYLVRLLPGPRGYYEQFEKKKLSKSFMRSINQLLRRLVDKGYLPEDQLVQIDQESLFAPPPPGFVPVRQPPARLPAVPTIAPGDWDPLDEDIP
ncbi:MAG: transglycosylase domain-containing protein, partial [Myxococcales bacterium]|nr:transglycosylase domain-containing protein [Myxococcales bacterium]